MTTKTSASPLDRALSSVGDRWTLLIVEALLDGPMRYSELREALPGIATNVLSQRLKHVTAEGVVVARPYSRHPPRYTYELSAAGRELAGALRLLAHWASSRAGGGDAARHRACGTPMEARWYCPTCARTVDQREEDDLRYV